MDEEEEVMVITFIGPKDGMEELLNFLLEEDPEVGLGYPDYIRSVKEIREVKEVDFS